MLQIAFKTKIDLHVNVLKHLESCTSNHGIVAILGGGSQMNGQGLGEILLFNLCLSYGCIFLKSRIIFELKFLSIFEIKTS